MKSVREAGQAGEQLRRFVIEAVADVPEIQLVYLFGSQVEGDIGPKSDYDLGVMLDSARSWPQVRAQFSHKLTKELETDRVDLVLLNAAPVELAYAIIAQGEVLYQRDVASRVDYEARVMSLYGDYLPILREQQRDILRGSAYDTRVQRYRATIRRTERTLGQVGATPREDTH
jgi:predicted nucleotidyltransferase